MELVTEPRTELRTEEMTKLRTARPEERSELGMVQSTVQSFVHKTKLWTVKLDDITKPSTEPSTERPIEATAEDTMGTVKVIQNPN